MSEKTLTPNEVKVLKQITSLDYGKGTQMPSADLDFVASETKLTYEQVEEALKELHYNTANILKVWHHDREHWKTIEVTDRTYEVARMYK